MRKSIIAPLLAIAMSGSATADETWTLQRCVDYALENNLTVKNSHLQVDQSEIDVTSAKDAFSPHCRPAPPRDSTSDAV